MLYTQPVTQSARPLANPVPSPAPGTTTVHATRLLASLLTGLLLIGCEPVEPPPIKIGVLHSLSGPMANSETPLVDAIQLAIDDINATGGVLGRPLEAQVVDGASDPDKFASSALALINATSVPVIFGCWTSTCRKAVKPVVENFDQLLFYPLQYEGLEQSANIVYTGAAPNQQIIPGIHWALEHLGRRLYLLGSDYVFPHAANLLIRDLADLQQADIIAERYLSLTTSQATAGPLQDIIADIARQQPDVIINTINGAVNEKLFPALRGNPRAATIPVLSFSLSEAELATIGSSATTHHYAVWSYFQSLDNPVNSAFVQRFQQRFGTGRSIGDAMESAWVGVHLWAQAARDAGSIAPAAVRQTIGRQSMNAPEGIISVDAANHHLWKTVHVGEAQANGQFRIVWSSDQPIRPEPFPQYRPTREWQQRVAPLLRADHRPPLPTPDTHQ